MLLVHDCDLARILLPTDGSELIYPNLTIILLEEVAHNRDQGRYSDNQPAYLRQPVLISWQFHRIRVRCHVDHFFIDYNLVFVAQNGDAKAEVGEYCRQYRHVTFIIEYRVVVPLSFCDDRHQVSALFQLFIDWFSEPQDSRPLRPSD